MMQDGSPAHLNVLYIVNQPRWIDRLLALVRPMLRNDSIRQKILLIGNKAEAQLHFAPANLPQQWGGSLVLDWEGQLERWAADERGRPAMFDVSAFVGRQVRSVRADF